MSVAPAQTAAGAAVHGSEPPPSEVRSEPYESEPYEPYEPCESEPYEYETFPGVVSGWRVPQSTQSVPIVHSVNSAPGPPSSQSSSFV